MATMTQLQESWNKVIGGNAVIRTSARWDGMVKHLGYISIDLPERVKNNLSRAITTDRQLVMKSQDALRETKVVPDYRLTPRAFAHLKLARAIAFHFGQVAGVDAAVIPPASDRARTAGLYETASTRIMLHLETLETGRDTVDAMVHELGHHIAGLRVSDPMQAEDLQPAHSEAMTYVSAKVFDLAAKGQFDEYLKEAVW